MSNTNIYHSYENMFVGIEEFVMEGDPDYQGNYQQNPATGEYISEYWELDFRRYIFL